MSQRIEQIMGMPIKICTVEDSDEAVREAFDCFRSVDDQYSTYKSHSEISLINQGLPKEKWSSSMKYIFELCEQTKQQSQGYFEIKHNEKYDPSGLVKGWSIKQAAYLLVSRGVKNFFIEAGGDIQSYGFSAESKPWRFGIRNPFNRNEIVKAVSAPDQGVATSGTYTRGQHIYNPFAPNKPINDILSLTVVGPDIYEADRFATAAFAMGREGIKFIDSLQGFEGYMIDSSGVATLSHGFGRFVV